jgi:IclR family transcriptional regulator, KDG regulon repressor
MAATIKSVEKAIDLLFLFDGDRSVMDVKTIARTLGIPLRTTYRLANTLRNRHALTIEERTGLCRLGPRLRSLLAAIDDSTDIPRRAGPFLAALATATGETAQLYLPQGDEVLLVDIAESPHVLRAGPRKGQRIPLHCGAGAKAVFAFQPPEEWDAYIRRNGLKPYGPNTVTSPEKLKRDLVSIRRTRFAVSHQEFIPGVRSLGVPLRDASDRVMGSLGLVGPDTRLTLARARGLKPLMQKTAMAVSAAVWGSSNGAARSSDRPSPSSQRPGTVRGAYLVSRTYSSRRKT